MRAALLIVVLGLFAPHTAARAEDAKPAAAALADAAALTRSAQAVLREACDLALKQGKKENFWTERVLLTIGAQQIRAGDFDGAMKSISGSTYTYERERGLFNLAKALARAGKKERALEITRSLEEADKRSWNADRLHDVVHQEEVEFFIAQGNLDLASQTVDALKSHASRREGRQRLASAHAKAGDAARAAALFKQAVDAAGGMTREYDRAMALWEIGEAQRQAGTNDAANATLRRLADEAARFKDPWARVSALRECAALAGRLKDAKAAHELFAKAIEAQPLVNGLNNLGALEYIAVAQAEAGFIQDAATTAAMIKHSEERFADDSHREEALVAIAAGQLRAGDAEGAVASALAVKHFVQYRDDALDLVVAHHIAKADFKSALAATDSFQNASNKAAGMLRVAAAQAKAGDRKGAAEIASRIVLAYGEQALVVVQGAPFDYRAPRTWGNLYDSRPYFTGLSHAHTVERGAKVAAAAMALAIALDQRPTQSYALLFNDVHFKEVIESLARAHAASGDADEAVTWARQIGGDKGGDDDARTAATGRIHALLGAAEGMLDRVAPRP